MQTRDGGCSPGAWVTSSGDTPHMDGDPVSTTAAEY